MGFTLALILSVSVSMIVVLFSMVVKLLRKVQEVDYSVDAIEGVIKEKFDAQETVLVRALEDNRRAFGNLVASMHNDVREDITDLAYQVDVNLQSTGEEIVSALREDGDSSQGGDGGDEIKAEFQAPFLEEEQHRNYIA